MANNEKKQTARDKIQIIYPIVVDVYKGRRTLNDGARLSCRRDGN